MSAILSSERLPFNNIQIKKYQHDTGRTKILTICMNSNGSLNIAIYGGESPHIGAVVMAIPRASLSGNGTISSDCFILPVPGHKDYLIADKVAREVASRTNSITIVSAGIHNNNITLEEISAILHNIDNIIVEIIRDFSLFYD